MKNIMKNGIVIFVLCICAFFICSGCGRKTEKQTAAEKQITVEKQTAGEDGLVTMSAALTEDNDTTLVWTIINKTKKDIMIGEVYTLQVLKDKSFVDVPRLPEAAGFNLLGRDILSGQEYSDRVDIEHNYGDLEAGRYRIVKEYTNNEKGSQKKENADEETVSAEFDLP